MMPSDTSNTVVRFAGAVPAADRAVLVRVFEEHGLVAGTGLDLGSRGPAETEPAATVIIMGDAHNVDRTTSAARQWLVASANLRKEHVQIEVRATGATVIIKADDPDSALQAVAEILPTLSGSSPIGWDGIEWRNRPRRAPRVPASAAPRVLALDTHWFSAVGGLTTFNRTLCLSLAETGADVTCVVLNTSDQELSHAAQAGVRLVRAPETPGSTGREALYRRPDLAGWEPDLIIGHGRVTGPHAKVLAEDYFPSARRLHVVHTSSDEIEWQRPIDPDRAGVRAETNTRTEVELARTADLALGVGPRLHSFIDRELSIFDGVPRPARLDPGFDVKHPGRRVPPAGHIRQVLVFGRLDDWSVKGVDIAARTVATACDLIDGTGFELELLLRGVPSEEHRQIRDLVLGWCGAAPVRVTPRSYTTDMEELRQDLRRASLVLMPSRAEGFGLAGLEAIVAGAPALVSEHSGLGMLLRETLSPHQGPAPVLPVGHDEDVRAWADAAAAILRDPTTAFDNAGRVRDQMSAKVTWAAAATVVLGA